MLEGLRRGLILTGLVLGWALGAWADASATGDLPEEAFLALPTPIAPAGWPVSTLPPVDKRLFGVIPNYRADAFQANYKPITWQQKFAIARSDSFDWPNYILLAGYAVQAQVAAGGFKHAGGMASFGEFYGRSVGDQIIGSYLTEAVMPSWLHEDPRFFRLGVGTIWYRAYYAASRIWITRKDDGRLGFNISEIAGNAGVTVLTGVYYPNSNTAGEAAERYGMALGNDAISNLLTEFWPDVKRRLRFLRRP